MQKNGLIDWLNPRITGLVLIRFILLSAAASGQDLLPSSDHPIIKHVAYSLGYSEPHEQVAWVYYLLDAEHTVAKFERTDNFRPDPYIGTGSADDEDYKGSGYDRGHLAPAADMAWSETAMSESFFYSNMSPQHPSFNRGIWKKLEEQVRSWALVYDSIYIVTGPILGDSLMHIGFNEVSVPNFYYKVVLDCKIGHQQAIGFLLPNEPSNETLENFALSIDELEIQIGFDLFTDLPDSLEMSLEANACISCWDWKMTKPSSIRFSSSTSVSCSGQTKEGSSCQINTQNKNGFCHLHQDQVPEEAVILSKREVSVQCAGTTKSGTQCKHMTFNSNSRCFQHGGE